MKRQIRNAISCMAIIAFAGIGLLAYGQCPCPARTVVAQKPVEQTVGQPAVVQQTVEQTVTQQTVVQQPVEQTCTQPTVVQHVQDFVVQPATTAAPVACADLCELVKDIEKAADHLRSEFKDSIECLECADESYYDSVKEFERATDRLKKHYRHSCDSCDVVGDVQEVLALANCISAYMDPCSHCPEVIEEWTELQADLQQLATQFCTTASFQQPVSLACPVPVCAQPACPQPAPVIVQPTCPAPVAQPAPAPSPVPFK
ncbi:MAG TPA: hypothetical protein VIM99_08035 [Blastocatellia bacterium]